jgi:hypothetical protein
MAAVAAVALVSQTEAAAVPEESAAAVVVVETARPPKGLAVLAAEQKSRSGRLAEPIQLP